MCGIVTTFILCISRMENLLPSLNTTRANPAMPQLLCKQKCIEFLYVYVYSSTSLNHLLRPLFFPLYKRTIYVYCGCFVTNTLKSCIVTVFVLFVDDRDVICDSKPYMRSRSDSNERQRPRLYVILRGSMFQYSSA